MDVTKDVTILFDLVKNVALFNPFLQVVYLTRKNISVYQSHLSGARINSSPTRGMPIMKANSKCCFEGANCAMCMYRRRANLSNLSSCRLISFEMMSFQTSLLQF